MYYNFYNYDLIFFPPQHIHIYRSYELIFYLLVAGCQGWRDAVHAQGLQDPGAHLDLPGPAVGLASELAST